MIAKCLQISMAVSKFNPTHFEPPKGSKVKYLNFAITKAIVNIFSEVLHAGRAANRYEIYQTEFQFEGLGPILLGGLRRWGRGQNKLFQNMVLLHIKLKLTTLAATW